MAVDKAIIQVRPNTGVDMYEATNTAKYYIQTNY